MEIVIVISTILLFLSTIGAFFLIFKVIKVGEKFIDKVTPLLNLPTNTTFSTNANTLSEQDSYTPENSDRSKPLSDFTPNFKREVKVKFDDEDQITPLDDEKKEEKK